MTAIIGLLLWGSPAQAGDWHHGRGPGIQGDGHGALRGRGPTMLAHQQEGVSGLAAPGENAYSTLYYIYPDRIGHATFHHYGEWLYACDDDYDGRTVTAELYWSGATRAVVRDGNGASSGCGTANLSIAEGTAVALRVCVSDPRRCDDWRWGRA